MNPVLRIWSSTLEANPFQSCEDLLRCVRMRSNIDYDVHIQTWSCEYRAVKLRVHINHLPTSQRPSIWHYIGKIQQTFPRTTCGMQLRVDPNTLHAGAFQEEVCSGLFLPLAVHAGFPNRQDRQHCKRKAIQARLHQSAT